MMQHLFFLPRRRPLDSDPCWLLSMPLFSMPESTELGVSQQFNVLKSYKIEAEDSQMHFFSLLESADCQLVSHLIFHMDFGGFIIQFICWSYLI